MDYFPSLSPLPPLLLYGTLLVTVCCLAIHYLVYSRRVTQWRKSNIPFLRPTFLIGHKYFLNWTKNSGLVSLDRIYKENSDKDAVGFFLGALPMVMLRSPALIKQVFVNNSDKAFEQGLVGARNDEVGKTTPAVCTDKNEWRSSRKTLSPMFATSRMGGAEFGKISKQIGSLWAHAEEACHAGRPINTRQISLNFFMDSVSHSFFGLEANSYEKEGDMLQVVMRGSQPNITTMLRLYAHMLFYGSKIFKSFNILTTRQVDAMKWFMRRQIERKAQLDSSVKDFMGFIERLQDSGKDGKKDSEMIVTNKMLGLGFTVAFGAAPFNYKYKKPVTTMDTLSVLAIHLLSLHPEYQQKIREEVSAAMRKYNTSEFTYEVVKELDFTAQCLFETGRLLPNLHFLTRVCLETFKVPGFDYTFKKGERVMVNVYSVHRDPAYFENPEKFDPERFSPGRKNEIALETYLQYGIGPRKCPGAQIVMLLAATLIGSLVYKYELKPHSHKKQMDARDFNPMNISNVPREDVLVDLVPWRTTVAA